MVSQCQEGNNLQNTFQYTGRAFLGIQDNYSKNLTTIKGEESYANGIVKYYHQLKELLKMQSFKIH